MSEVTQELDDTRDEPGDTAVPEAHGGAHAVEVAAAHGVDTMFTLSGAHVFPMYDGAVNPVREGTSMRILDVRHEQTAVFAASDRVSVPALTDPSKAYALAGFGFTFRMMEMKE